MNTDRLRDASIPTQQTTGTTYTAEDIPDSEYDGTSDVQKEPVSEQFDGEIEDTMGMLARGLGARDRSRS